MQVKGRLLKVNTLLKRPRLPSPSPEREGRKKKESQVFLLCPESHLLHKIVTSLCWRDKMAETWGYSRENGMWRCLFIVTRHHFMPRSQNSQKCAENVKQGCVGHLVLGGRVTDRVTNITSRAYCDAKNLERWPVIEHDKAKSSYWSVEALY